jgi:aminoglycoside/choline kinase family phosphotransferase
MAPGKAANDSTEAQGQGYCPVASVSRMSGEKYVSTLATPSYLPADRAEVDERWLKETLASHPEFQKDPMVSASFAAMGDGVGQMSELLRATVQRASGDELPLVIKLQTSVEDMRNIAIRYHHYLREVNFYTHLADEVPVHTPKVYAAGYDQDSRRTALVMEHIGATHYSPDQIAGASLEEVQLAIDHLARLTATFWDSPLRATHSWMGNANADFYRSSLTDYPASIDEVMERFGSGIPGMEAAARGIAAHLGEIHDYLCEGVQVLTHWDYRVENMFFHRSDPDQFVLLDWQLMLWMRPGWDFVYLVGSCMDEGLRREHFDDLVDRYLDGLRSHGVTDYSRDDFTQDLRMAAMACTIVAIVGGGGYDVGNPRSAELFRVVGSRSFSLVDELDCLRILG